MSSSALSSRNFIHPFPARMAPELALIEIEALPANSLVVDPMMGSGTVLLAANQAGHRSIGSDLDPLAVLISRVSNSPLDYEMFLAEAAGLVVDAKNNNCSTADIPWMSGSPETLAFVDYWFAVNQQAQLASLSMAVQRKAGILPESLVDAYKIAISRLIVTKEMKASLARDTSHSRPHRVALENTFNVLDGFIKSVEEVAKRHARLVRNGSADVFHGDARNIPLAANSCDALITSPPYLNAIDYLRGHRMALVWLGYNIAELRGLRSNSVGAERSMASRDATGLDAVVSAFGDTDDLGTRYRSIIHRYAHDLLGITVETHRVLKEGARAVFVIGNSCLRGTFVDNASALQTAAEHFGLELQQRSEREIPERNRYLPLNLSGGAQLGKRMRTEVVLSFRKA